MKYRVYGDDYVIVMEKGEEILQVLTEVCRREQILLGTVTGIGAVGTVVLGILFLHEPASLARLFFIATLIASIIGLKMVSH